MMTDAGTANGLNDGRTGHPASWPEEQLMAQCRIAFSRASGPGGQNRNKVETSVQIEFLPNHIVASASERRTQKENRDVALQRLRCKLAVELRPTAVGGAETQTDVASRPSETWMRYCRGGRIDIADSNRDWPTVLAELVGTLVESDWNLGLAASRLGTSSSQCVKLLKKHAAAFLLLNRERGLRGQRPLD